MDGEAPLIAIVDDEEVVRRALLRLLRSARYRAEAFESGASFLESLSRGVPSCVILDLQMPEMTGFELQQRLRQLAVRLPVIVITAYDEVDTRQRCLALGAGWYFRKPLEGDDLLEAIRLAVDSPAGGSKP